MKKTIISILCVILIFIPTYIAIANYIATKDQPISNRYVEKMDIRDLSGKSFSNILKTDNKGDIVSFFVNMNDKAKKVSELPDSLAGTEFYQITFYSGRVAEEYKYYLNIEGKACYFEDSEGEVYEIKSEDVDAFLETKYALSLYEKVGVPDLKSDSGTVILPKNVEWHYSIDGKKFINVSGFETTDDVISYKMDGGVALTSTVAPDNYIVKVYDANGELISEQTTTDISSIDIGNGTHHTFVITACWYEDENRNYYGEASYNFQTEIMAGAEFFIGESAILPGEFVAISAYNVSNPEKITFKSEPEINYTPKFYKDGDKAVAFVPITPDLTHDSYVFTLSYGGTTQNINLNMMPKKFNTSTHNISKKSVENFYSEAALEEFNNLFDEICSKSIEEKLFDGPFIDYDTDALTNFKIICGFGHNRKISSTGTVYRNNYVDFKADKGAALPACNSGEVVYTGLTIHGGNMVVIDHGMGIKTWYMHLDEIKTEVGAKVEHGDIIGTAGKTGFTETNGVLTMMTVENVPVCPYNTWEFGVVIYEKTN